VSKTPTRRLTPTMPDRSATIISSTGAIARFTPGLTSTAGSWSTPSAWLAVTFVLHMGSLALIIALGG